MYLAGSVCTIISLLSDHKLYYNKLYLTLFIKPSTTVLTLSHFSTPPPSPTHLTLIIKPLITVLTLLYFPHPTPPPPDHNYVIMCFPSIADIIAIEGKHKKSPPPLLITYKMPPTWSERPQ